MEVIFSESYTKLHFKVFWWLPSELSGEAFDGKRDDLR